MSIPEIRNSLNQTSPERSSPNLTDGFFNPIINVLILPSDGLPLIASLYFFCPGRELIGVNSKISFNSSSKYIVSPNPNFCNALAFSFESNSIDTSIEFESGIHTSSEVKLFETFSS